jgi:hypothetical protein
MSRDDLTSLLETLAEEVDHMPQREYSEPAWARAQGLRRRRVVLGAAAAVVLIAVPVALFLPRDDSVVGPAEPVYSEAPLRPLAAHTATLLDDGRVLIVGGCATDGCTTAEVSPSAEFYVPGQGFTAGPELGQPRQGHSATLLSDGRVLVVGGWAREGTEPLDSAEVYDPQTGRFSTIGPLTTPRGASTATTLPDGRVLIIGGGDDREATEVFDPKSDTFTPAAPMPEGSGGGGAIALSDGRVLVVGDQDEARDARPGALYDPTADTWQLIGSLATPRSKFTLAPLPDGRVLILGGTPDDRQLLRSTEIYDPSTGQFESGPSMDTARYKFVTASVADGRIVVGGGTQLEVYDSGQFRPIPGTVADTPRWVPTVTSLPDGDVLVVGGYDDRINLYSDAQLISASLIATATG